MYNISVAEGTEVATKQSQHAHMLISNTALHAHGNVPCSAYQEVCFYTVWPMLHIFDTHTPVQIDMMIGPCLHENVSIRKQAESDRRLACTSDLLSAYWPAALSAWAFEAALALLSCCLFRASVPELSDSPAPIGFERVL